MKLFHSSYMELAISLAKKAASLGEIPVGAVVVDNTKKAVIATAYNQTIALNDATAHAEILAIKEACLKLKNHRLEGCSLYVTLEPCPMCAGALLSARIPYLYYGAQDSKFGAIEHRCMVFQHQYPHNINIFSGIYEEECQKLMVDFFKDKR
jgi:tRNA(adenine34) deaminase